MKEKTMELLKDFKKSIVSDLDDILETEGKALSMFEKLRLADNVVYQILEEHLKEVADDYDYLYNTIHEKLDKKEYK